MKPSRLSIAARSSGPRFLASNGTMHQATRLSWANSLARRRLLLGDACPGEADTSNRRGCQQQVANQVILRR